MKLATVLRPAAAVALGALVLAGCSDDKKDDAKDAAAPSGAASSAAVPADAPKKIVSLAPTATEMLYAIGAGKQVVAVDDQSNFPADAPKTALSGFKPNVEAITKYTPDLVVLTNDTDGIKAQLEKVKIKVVEVPAAKTFDEMYAQFNTLGTATGHAKEAADLAAKTKKDIDEVVAKAIAVKPAKPLTYFHEVDNTGYSATSKTFIGQVYSLFAMQNIADPADKDGSGYPQVSTEHIVEANPDMIFLADTKCCGQDAAAVAKRPGWDKTNAVKNGNVVSLDDDLASRWGPRVVDLVKSVADAYTKAVAKAGATG